MSFAVIYTAHERISASVRETCFATLLTSLFPPAYWDKPLGGPATLVAICPELPRVAELFSERDIVHIPWAEGELSHKDIYTRILTGLARLEPDTPVCVAEHDVLYPEGYFHAVATTFQATYRWRIPAIPFLYNTNVYHLSPRGFFPAADDARFFSNLTSRTEFLLYAIERKLEECDRRPEGHPIWTEPGVGEERPPLLTHYPLPVLDVRHGRNLTGERMGGVYLDTLDYWNSARDWLRRFEMQEACDAR
jgi:hypothetical protein